MRRLLLLLALCLVPMATFAHIRPRPRPRPRPPARKAPAKNLAQHEANLAVLREVDRLIGEAARHIGARQAREAVAGTETDAQRFLRQLAGTVDLFAAAQAGKRPVKDALVAAQAMHEAALSYDQEPAP